MSSSERWGRKGRMVRVDDVLSASGAPGHARVDWPSLVGPALAGVSALVGLSSEGVIRVATANDAACAELRARAAHVIAAFNSVAERLGAARASGLEAWVAADFRAQRVAAPAPARPAPAGPRHEVPTAPSDEALARASEQVGEVADARLRRALVRARAIALDREARGAGRG